MSRRVKLELPIAIYVEDGVFAAVCKPFNVASQGLTEEEALKNVKEALKLYLDDEDVRQQYHDKIDEFVVNEESACVSVEINDWAERKITPIIGAGSL